MQVPVVSGADHAAVAAARFEAVARPRHPRRQLQVLALLCKGGRLVAHGFTEAPPSTWLLLDAAVLATCISIAYEIFPPPVIELTPHIVCWQAVAIFSFVAMLSGLVFGLHERETLVSRARILTRMLLASTTVAVVAYAIIYVMMYATVSRRVACLALSAYLLSGTGARLAAWWAIQQRHRRLLVVGRQAVFESFRAAQHEGHLPQYDLLGFASLDATDRFVSDSPYYVGTLEAQINQLERLGITDIVIGGDAARDARVMGWVVAALRQGCRVTNEATFYEKATGTILVDELTPLWFLLADLKVHCERQATLKRVFDLFIAVVGLALTLPFWPLIALAVKLCDGGPVFYGQLRMGQHGRAFKLFKFRTMRPDAENGRSVWATQNDPRVTPVGRLLRKTRLDELPQLLNVVLGQMSFIGPRPERPDIVKELNEKIPYFQERHLVKPGLTGWAQISFRYGSSIEDAKRKLEFDLYYLKHMSFELDMMILFRTLGVFLRGAC